MNNFLSLKLIIDNWKKVPYYGFIKGHIHMDDEVIKDIYNLLVDSNFEIIEKYEKKFSYNIGQGKAVSFAAGRMGFYAILKILGIQKTDEVILLGHTCSVMVNAVWRSGAKPVFADIDPDTYGSSRSEIEKAITSRTKMIVAQHSFGIPCRIEPIVELARSKGIFLLEDCALTFGSKVNGVAVGNFGDAALFSFDHSKPINAFIGGLIYTHNNDLFKKLKKIQISSKSLPLERQEAIWKKFLFERKYFNPWKYSKSFLVDNFNRFVFREPDSYLTDDYDKISSSTYPYPAKLPSFLAKLGLFELDRWKIEKKKRQKLLITFMELSELVGIKNFLPSAYFDRNLEIVPLRFVYTHPSADITRMKMSQYVDINWFWFLQPIIACKEPRDLGYVYGRCPISENVGEKIINWPCVFSESDNQKLLKYFQLVHAS